MNQSRSINDWAATTKFWWLAPTDSLPLCSTSKVWRLMRRINNDRHQWRWLTSTIKWCNYDGAYRFPPPCSASKNDRTATTNFWWLAPINFLPYVQLVKYGAYRFSPLCSTSKARHLMRQINNEHHKWPWLSSTLEWCNFDNAYRSFLSVQLVEHSVQRNQPSCLKSSIEVKEMVNEFTERI